MQISELVSLITCMWFGLLLDIPYCIVWVIALVSTCELKGQASNVKVGYKTRKIVLNFVIFFTLNAVFMIENIFNDTSA